MDYDLVIAGGGPAGSTVASLVKKYAPQLRVLLLEKAHFPRHHVGESLLAGASPVLREMGAYDAVNAYGFPEKLGASYVWGHERKTWGFEFEQVIANLVAQGKRVPELYTKGWQVRRGEYDHLLLKHAAEMGAEVREGAAVRGVLRDSSGRVIGAEYRDDSGSHTVHASWFMDCTGQDALLGHELKLREYDENMNNYALFGYWQGGKWKVEYLGHPNLTRIFIATTPRGWIWYIPVKHDIISVGFVTHRQTLKNHRLSIRDLYREEIAACPEISGLLDGAKLVRIAPDQAHDIVAIQDWSYTSKQMVGDGWAMAGDAAGFVDPILSSGVMLAHELGQKAAYTLNSCLSASSDAQIQAYWDFYQDTYRTYLQAYRDMATFWYSNNFSMESWWWTARRNLTHNDSTHNLSEREAFNRLASGYANRAESLSLFGSYPLHEAQKLVDGLFGTAETNVEAAQVSYGDKPLQLNPQARLSSGMYFFQGQIRTTRRIVVPATKQYLDLHPGEEMLVHLLDGAHTLDDLNNAANNMRGLAARMPVRSGTELVIQLDEIGALA